MNESIRTAIFAAAAGVIGLVTWISWEVTAVPEFSEPEKVAMEGKLLFPGFRDPLAATSLEIVKYDEETALADSFKVAQIDGEWSIPSHSNYPADAEDQLAEAASSMMELRVVDKASDDPRTHAMYGVADPSSKPASTPAEDVGVRVVMRDKDDKELMALIIGKEVPDRDELRYVRAVDKNAVDKNAVYTMVVKTDKLSNKFEDWIEEDLLKLTSWDIRRVEIQDYAFDVAGDKPVFEMKGQMTLEHDDTGDPKWKLTENLVFDSEKGKVPAEKAEDEELDTDKLDDLSSALGDLKIVDVQRKPAGLSADLRLSGTLAPDLETQLSLQLRGYYLVPVQERYLQLLSNQGETRVVMKDGVEYVLRFGEDTGTSESDEGKEEAEDKKQDGDPTDQPEKDGENGEPQDEEPDEDQPGMNRYLFVMAEFNPDVISKPELEPLPEEQKKPDPDEAGQDAAPGDGDNPEGPPEEKPAGGSASEKTDGQSTENSDGASADESQEKTDGDSAEGKEEKADGADAGADAGDEPDVEKERERILKDNKRKQQEYDDKIEEGRKKVEELNARFADWYYIISDEVFQKIHLGRDNIIKKKEKKEEENGKENGKEGDTDPGDAGQQPEEPAGPLDEFNRLKQEGPGGSE